ncbi:MAG TPA: PLP-dependent aminotransferase family protein [Thermoanaerobaculia bacterium]|nr:PLP-dependent aminotransferase family protein [Thermoanaerobaculia bacterium]
MELHVRLEGRSGLARQIYRQIRAAIAGGRLKRGDRLPPTRELAQRLDVSRNTVALAFEWLVAEGLLSGRTGAGTFVENDPLARGGRKPSGAQIRHRAIWNELTILGQRGPAPPYDFGVGTPDVRLFPFDAWRRLQARQLRVSELAAGYGDPAGHPKLREMIARHVAVARGAICRPEDVIVTNGAQQAFDLIARVLLEPNAQVAVEEPGYPPPRMLFESLGARVAGVPVDDAGLDVAALPDQARLVYVTPSHQFPLGMPMSHPRRQALLDWAERRNAVIIEDDYDTEFRFGGRPLETLQASDRSGRVIYVGSFSKSMLPALRLGFMIAPEPLQKILQTANFVAGWHSPWPTQAALAAFMEKGLFVRHIRKMRREYAARHDRIVRTLARDFSRWLDPVVAETGMHVCATLRSQSVRREGELAARARKAGVGVDRLSKYCRVAERAGFVFGYGAIPTAKIDEGLRRLHACLAQ